MKRRPAIPEPGIPARWPDTCLVCHEDIQQGISRVVYRRGRPLHVECHGGQDE